MILAKKSLRGEKFEKSQKINPRAQKIKIASMTPARMKKMKVLRANSIKNPLLRVNRH